MHVALALASNTETSSLAAVASTAPLTSPKLPDLLQLNSQRLKETYTIITDFFKRKGIRYIPVNSAPYVFARLVPNAQSWEEESFMIGQLKLSGVVVSSGKAYHVNEEEKGWCRMTFALERSRLEEAIKRMETVIGQQERN